MVDTTIEATILIKAVHNFLETTDNVNKRDRDEISIKYNTLENKYKEKIFRANEVMEKNKYTIELPVRKNVVKNLVCNITHYFV